MLTQAPPFGPEDIEQSIQIVDEALADAEPWDDETWVSLYTAMGLLQDGPEWAQDLSWALRGFLHEGGPIVDLKEIAEQLRGHGVVGVEN